MASIKMAIAVAALTYGITGDLSAKDSDFGQDQAAVIVGEKSGESFKKWHKVTLDFHGPQCSETDEFNPFMNYRLDVEFTHVASGKRFVVPGYFAADGNAADT